MITIRFDSNVNITLYGEGWQNIVIRSDNISKLPVKNPGTMYREETKS